MDDLKMGSHQLKVQKKRTAKIKEKRKKICIFALTLVILLLLISSIIYAKYSQYKQVHSAFAKYGETEISKIEYIFFYNNFVSKWVTNNYDNLETYGLDLDKPFSSQIYNKETNETWEDYFDETVNNFISTIYAEYEQANKDKFKDTEDSLNKFIEDTKNAAQQEAISYKEYLHKNYSEDMSIKDFESIAQLYTRAIAYDNAKFDEFEKAVTDKDIEDYYKNNKDLYDIITYKYFMINTSNSNDATDKEKKELKKEAESIKKQIINEETFNTVASHNIDGEIKEYKANSSTSVTADITDWIYSSNRKPGDFDMIKNDSGTIYYFVFFKSRKLDTDKTVNYRAIYKQFKIDKADDKNIIIDPDNDKAKNDLITYEEAKKIIQGYADEYTDSPKESTIAKIAQKENIDNEGLYYNITKSQINNNEVKNWLWDDYRKEKDIKIIEDTDNGYIYLFYWKNDGEPYYKIAIKNGIASDNYNKWIESLKRKTLLLLTEQK